ncbi:MAG TPA: ParA family protein [Pseudonocardiaceae bacterium]|nr:ParA family protein [Pseudonocardiaceae bacterium]
MLRQAISVINGKGGTGKTSIVANLAGLFAAAEYRVLAVDLDPQGNLGRDLGYLDASDGGQALFSAVMTPGAPLGPLRDVRPGLDVICGGEYIEDLSSALAARSQRGKETTRAVRDQLAPLAGDYDLILIDCPPGNRPLQQQALSAAHYALIPTRSDDASLDGLVRVAELFAAARETTNPGIELLGVVLFGIGSRARRIAEAARSAVARDLGDATLMFDTEIRHVEGPAQDCRRLGRLVHEIEAELPDARRARFAWLRARRGQGSGKHRPAPESVAAAATLAASAPHLAGDYQRLAEELLGRLAKMSEVAV